MLLQAALCCIAELTTAVAFCEAAAVRGGLSGSPRDWGGQLGVPANLAEGAAFFCCAQSI